MCRMMWCALVHHVVNDVASCDVLGLTMRFLQQQTRAHIQIQTEHDAPPGQPERTVFLRVRLYAACVCPSNH
jgi:hypothetical protein